MRNSEIEWYKKGMKMKMFKHALMLLIVGLLCGCNSSLKHITLPEKYIETLPETVKLDVPHIPQNDRYSCATTSLAMVMSYYDKKRYEKSDVWDASGSLVSAVTKNGNDMAGLKRAAEHFGFTRYEFATGLSIDSVKYLVSKHIPVIINIKNFHRNSYHAVVITGYDKEGFFIADPANYTYSKTYAAVNAHWQAKLSSPRGEVYKSGFIVYPK